MKDIGIILRACIDYRNTFNEFAKGYAPAEITYANGPIIINPDSDPFTSPHDELIHGIINNLFQEDINAVVRMRTVAQPPYVHTRAKPDMLKRAQCLDL